MSDFRIVIEDSGATAYAVGPAGVPVPAPPPPVVPHGTAPEPWQPPPWWQQAQPASQAQAQAAAAEMPRPWINNPGVAGAGGESAADRAGREFRERRKYHRRHLELMRARADVRGSADEEAAYRYRSGAVARGHEREVRRKYEALDSPDDEAKRLREDQADADRRRLEVLKARHRIEGAAEEQARSRYEMERESYDFARRVEAEYRKALPAAEEAARLDQQQADAQARRLEVLREWGKIEGSAAAEARSRLDMELEVRNREREVRRERAAIDSPDAEARRLHEDQMEWERRRLDVMKARHRIEGSAEEETRLQLEAEREQGRRRRELAEERARQDPASAVGGAMQGYGRLLGSLGAPGLGRLLQAGGGIVEAVSEYQSTAPGGAEEAARAAAPPGAQQAAQQGQQAAQQGQQAAQQGQQAGQQAAQQAGQQAAQRPAAPQAAQAGAASQAGAAGGAAASAAAALPLVGAALAAKQAVEDMATDAARSARQAQQQIMSGAAEVARGDGVAVISRGVSATAEMSRKLPLVGGMVGEVIESFGDKLKGVQEVADALIRYGKERLSPYSASIQAASAYADVRTIMGDVREANALGEPTARLIDIQSKLYDEFRDVMTPLKASLTEFAVTMLGFARDLMPLMRVVVAEVKNLVDFVRFIMEVVARLAPGFAALVNRNNEPPPDPGLAAEFERFFGRAPIDEPQPPQQNPQNRMFP